MTRFVTMLQELWQDRTGSILIETAIVAPVLVLMSLGAFQISMIMARQAELQTAIAEGEAIALATTPDTAEKRQTLQQIMMVSTNLPIDKVLVSEEFRCNAETTYVAARTNCATTDRVTGYVKIELQDKYVPIWRKFGVGSDLSFRVVRYVIVDQRGNS